MIRRLLLTVTAVLLVGCGASHRSAAPSTTVPSTTTTTVFPLLATPDTQLLRTSGHGDGAVAVVLPFGHYDFQATCADPEARLDIVGVASLAPCVSGNNVTATVGPVHSITVRSTTSWTLYIGKP